MPAPATLTVLLGAPNDGSIGKVIELRPELEVSPFSNWMFL